MRAIFKDSNLQSQFQKQGYAVVSDFVNEKIVEELLSVYRKAHPKNVNSGFHCTLYSESEERKKFVNEEVRRVLEPAVKKWLLNYKPLVVDYPVKGANTKGDVAMHQDWTFVDEEKFISINVWIPLIDVTKNNGAYFVLSGSNKIAHTIRGSHIPLPCNVVKYKVEYKNMDYLPMKAGDAIIYDHRLMHRTPPNNSNENRIALSLNLIPEEAKAIHYYKHADSKKIELFEIEEDFFTKYTYNPSIDTNQLPEGVKSLGFLKQYEYVCFSENQVLPLYRNKSLIQKLKVGINTWKNY